LPVKGTALFVLTRQRVKHRPASGAERLREELAVILLSGCEQGGAGFPFIRKPFKAALDELMVSAVLSCAALPLQAGVESISQPPALDQGSFGLLGTSRFGKA
jgi:hypothetical protein